MKLKDPGCVCLEIPRVMKIEVATTECFTPVLLGLISVLSFRAADLCTVTLGYP